MVEELGGASSSVSVPTGCGGAICRGGVATVAPAVSIGSDIMRPPGPVRDRPPLKCTPQYWDDNFRAMMTVPYFYMQKFAQKLKGSADPSVLLVAPAPVPDGKELTRGGSAPWNLLSYFRGCYVLGFTGFGPAWLNGIPW